MPSPKSGTIIENFVIKRNNAMTDKQREATKIVLQQYSEGHLDAEEALTIIDSIVGEQPQVQYVPYQPLDLTPKPWDNKPYFQNPNDIFRVTCEHDAVTVGHTDNPNGSSVTAEDNVTRHYTKQ
jgi:hypothetical protein